MIVQREIGFRAFHSHHGMMFERNHPHDFKVVISMEGQPNEEGFICDFRAVKRMVGRLVVKELEGRNLDEIFEFATAENLAVWIWKKLEPFFPLYSVGIQEKSHSRATYYGPKQNGSYA